MQICTPLLFGSKPYSLKLYMKTYFWMKKYITYHLIAGLRERDREKTDRKPDSTKLIQMLQAITCNFVSLLWSPIPIPSKIKKCHTFYVPTDKTSAMCMLCLNWAQPPPLPPVIIRGTGYPNKIYMFKWRQTESNTKKLATAFNINPITMVSINLLIWPNPIQPFFTQHRIPTPQSTWAAQWIILSLKTESCCLSPDNKEHRFMTKFMNKRNRGGGGGGDGRYHCAALRCVLSRDICSGGLTRGGGKSSWDAWSTMLNTNWRQPTRM